ncbi:MAG: hypothetical protein AAF639_42715 [Chloroflexota bacterium]
MTHTYKRKIVVGDIAYEWCIRGNSLFDAKGLITIYKPTVRGQTLYLDGHSWHLEVRPQTIRVAIDFALEHGWMPDRKGASMYLGHDEDGFILLPPEIRSTDEYKRHIGHQDSRP